MGARTSAGAAEQGDGSLEDALAGLPEEARALAARGVKAARYAAEGDYGYLGGLVNMRVVEAEDGNTVLTMDVTPNALNRYGSVHGGMLFTFADYAMGAAARTLVPEGAKPVTLEAKANYVSNVKEGRLLARCTTVNQTKRLIVLETRIVNAETDDLVMIVTGTYYIIGADEGDE
jgi:acyl-CoA thioesterase